MAEITIPDEEGWARFNVTTAQSVFVFDFVYLEKADLTVYVDGVALGQGDWSIVPVVEDGGNNGGTVTLNTAVSNATVEIAREIVAERTDNLASGPISAANLNAEFRRLQMQLRDLQRDVARAARGAFGEGEIDLGSKVDRADKVLGFDASGNRQFFAADNFQTVANIVTQITLIADNLDTINTVTADLDGDDTIGASAALVNAGSPGIPFVRGAGDVILTSFGSGLSLNAATGELTLDADLDQVSQLTDTGFLVRVGANSWALRNMTATADRGLTITNPGGASGNTVFTLAQDIRSTASPTFAGATFTGNITVNGVSVRPSGASVGQVMGFPNDAGIMEPTSAGAGDLLASQNLSDVDNARTAGENLGVFDTAVETKAALAALTAGDYRAVQVLGRGAIGDGWGGAFDWISGDQSTAITRDPGEGIWVAPDSDATGASGAWKRRLSEYRSVQARWFSDWSSNSNRLAGLENCVSYLTDNFTGGVVELPAGTTTISGEWVISDGDIKVKGPGSRNDCYLVSSDTTAPCVTFAPTTAGVSAGFLANCGIEDVTVGFSAGDKGGAGSVGLWVRQCTLFDARNVRPTHAQTLLKISGGQINRFSDMTMYADPSGVGVKIEGEIDDSADSWQNAFTITFDNLNLFGQTGTDAMVISSIDGLTINGAYITPGTNSSMKYEKVNTNATIGAIKITGAYFDGLYSTGTAKNSHIQFANHAFGEAIAITYANCAFNGVPSGIAVDVNKAVIGLNFSHCFFHNADDWFVSIRGGNNGAYTFTGCNFRLGGDGATGGAMEVIGSDRLSVTGCRFEFNANHDIELGGTHEEVVIANNTFSGSTRDIADASATIAHRAYIGNASDAATTRGPAGIDAGAVATKADLEALEVGQHKSVFMAGRQSAGDGGGGVFIWRSGDQSANITNDPAGILWIASSASSSGASGAWQRANSDQGPINIFWAGATASSDTAATLYGSLAAVQADYPHATSTGNHLDWLAAQAILNDYPGRRVYMPGNTSIYYWNQGVEITDSGSGIYGDGPGQTAIYIQHSTDQAIYAGPSDPVNTANVSRVYIGNLRIASIQNNPSNIGIEVRQCASSTVENVHMFGFQKSFLNAGGIGNVYRKLDLRHDANDTTLSDSYVMKFIASDRGVNGFDPSFSHEISEAYLSGEGQLDATVYIGMGDGLHFANCYWKLGDRGVVLHPDGAQKGIRVDFTNCYLDGTSNYNGTSKSIHVPAFDATGDSVGQVTFNGCLIANALGADGKHVVVENPANGSVNFLKFDGCTFGNSLGECMDITNSARDLNLIVTGCTIRDGGGGIGVASCGSVIISNCVFEDVRDDSLIDLIHFTGTINAASVTGNAFKRLLSGSAGIFNDGANIDFRAFVYGNNVDTRGNLLAQHRVITVAADGVTAIPFNLAAGEFAQVRFSSYSSEGYGEVWFRYDGRTRTVSGPIEVQDNTALTGTSGNNLKVTVSYQQSSGNLYVESQIGALDPLFWEVIG